MSLPNGTRRLASALRIIFKDLQEAHPGPSADTSSSLIHFGRKYLEAIYDCIGKLREEQQKSGMDEEELQSELTRTIWSACIWELSMHVFVAQPTVLTERILPWWQHHMCDRQAEVDAKELVQKYQSGIDSASFPENESSYWSTIVKLVAQGLPEVALELLQTHSGFTCGRADAETLLVRHPHPPQRPSPLPTPPSAPPPMPGIAHTMAPVPVLPSQRCVIPIISSRR